MVARCNMHAEHAANCWSPRLQSTWVCNPARKGGSVCVQGRIQGVFRGGWLTLIPNRTLPESFVIFMCMLKCQLKSPPPSTPMRVRGRSTACLCHRQRSHDSVHARAGTYPQTIHCTQRSHLHIHRGNCSGRIWMLSRKSHGHPPGYVTELH